MYSSVIDHPEKCYGCGACVEACPQQCLDIVKDNLGFSIVRISDQDKCISCGLCSKVCQAQEMQRGKSEYIRRYCAQNRDKECLARSSSGGVFSAVALSVIRNKGIVWGVEMQKNGKTSFSCVTDESELEKLCGSKYVEVDSPAPYCVIKNQIESGALVMFTGTPCQIQGLNAFLRNKKYDNLILVDLLCYGIQSPHMWGKYLTQINAANKDIKTVQMRCKSPSWENYSMRIEFSDGSIYCKSRWKDPYLLSYATNLYNRPVCSDCKAKAFPRVSDITLGDFWQIDTLAQIPDGFKVDRGISIVLANTERGENFVRLLEQDLMLFEIPDDVFPNMIERFSSCSPVPTEREKFCKTVDNMGFSKAVKENVKSRLYTRLRFFWLGFKRRIKRVI